MNIDNSLKKDFAVFLAVSGKKIIDVAKETNINKNTLYNWRASGQKLSESTMARLRRYINSF